MDLGAGLTMPRTCTICAHPQRPAIDKALVGSGTFRNIALCFETSETALFRHKAQHLRPLLAQAQQREARRGDVLGAQVQQQDAAEQAHALDVMTELQRCFERVNLLFDACDRYLRDPDDPSRYDVGPRADDVLVTYLDRFADGSMRPKKAPLSRLLAKLADGGIPAEHWESKHADPRELILKTAGQLKGQVELLAKLLGELDERPQINVLISPEWLVVRTTLLQALAPYSDARVAVAARLGALEATNGHRG
jgi:hypothetical protein